jgi:predicted lipoprotein with Yx(FWY)xxD motif
MMRSTTVRPLIAMAAIPLTALAIGACGGGGSAASSGGAAHIVAPTTTSGKTATVGAASVPELGKILVDSQGRTLYLFQKDSGTTSACSGGCAAAWPPLRATGKPTAGTSLSASKLTTTQRSDGKPQVVYNGHPLYRYSADQKPGDTNGQGINAFGAPWFALTSAGTVVSGAGSNPNPGSGY